MDCIAPPALVFFTLQLKFRLSFTPPGQRLFIGCNGSEAIESLRAVGFWWIDNLRIILSRLRFSLAGASPVYLALSATVVGPCRCALLLSTFSELPPCKSKDFSTCCLALLYRLSLMLNLLRLKEAHMHRLWRNLQGHPMLATSLAQIGPNVFLHHGASSTVALPLFSFRVSRDLLCRSSP